MQPVAQGDRARHRSWRQAFRDTASDVWADTAYRSAANLALLERRGLRPQFQRKKPKGKEMPDHIARGKATGARVRSWVEHVFADQKCRLGLVNRTVSMVHARVKIGLANLARAPVLDPGRAEPAPPDQERRQSNRAPHSPQHDWDVYRRQAKNHAGSPPAIA
jgi:hypothetical protein